MADGVTVRLEGVEELKRALSDASKQIRTKAVRGALREAGKIIQAAARANAPVMQAPTKTRKPGTVKKAISVRASKIDRRAGNEGVFVSVRPLRGSRQNKLGKAGADNPNDPFYWRFVEFGTKPHPIFARRRKFLAFGGKFVKKIQHPGIKGTRFMTNAAEKTGAEAVQKFMQSVVPQIEKLNKRAGRVR